MLRYTSSRCDPASFTYAPIALYRRPDDPGFSVRVGFRDPAKLRGFLALIEDAAGLAPWRGAV
ncbi:hypothetical protein [Sorangium sp. So ce128]|uniref:hypothetical protein n=1 Tax=Sorangium sp. So ce128 TaxID=3133281 RepID=UPI003F615B41